MKQAVIRYAPPFDESCRELFRRGFERKLGEPVACEFIEDRTLLGGFQAFVDGVAYDASMAARLSGLSRRLND